MKKVLFAALLSACAMSASAALSQSCEKYFAEIDTFVKAVPAVPTSYVKTTI